MSFTGEPHYQSSGRPVSAVRSVTGSWPAPDRHRPAGRSPRSGAGGVIPWTSVRAHCVSASQMYMLHVFLPALWSPSQSEGMGAPGGLWVPDRFLRLLGPGTPELARTCCISGRSRRGHPACSMEGLLLRLTSEQRAEGMERENPFFASAGWPRMARPTTQLLWKNSKTSARPCTGCLADGRTLDTKVLGRDP